MEEALNVNVDQQDANVSHAPPPSNSTSTGGTQPEEAGEKAQDYETQTFSLYVGNLDDAVDEKSLRDLFGAVGGMKNAKVIRFRATGESQGFGFVDFDDYTCAEAAINKLNGAAINDKKIKVNWASQGNPQARKDDVSAHFNLFVGDLSPEVTDKGLEEAFSQFSSLSDARVMWDNTTGRSRGYGFVAFRDKADAEAALSRMNGECIGNRNIRLNWAYPKNNSRTRRGGIHRSHGNDSRRHQEFYAVSMQAPQNCVVYVGNLPRNNVTEDELRRLFDQCGKIENIRVHEKGFSFLTFESHEQATSAICRMNGKTFKNRVLRTGWGRELPRGNSNRAQNFYGVATYPMTPTYHAFNQYPSGGFRYGYQQEAAPAPIPPENVNEGQQNYQQYSYPAYYAGYGGYGFGGYPGQYQPQPQPSVHQAPIHQTQPQGMPQAVQHPQQMQHTNGPPQGVMEPYTHMPGGMGMGRLTETRPSAQ